LPTKVAVPQHLTNVLFYRKSKTICAENSFHNMANHDVIIVGAGMAGLTCATYLNRFGIKPLVIEASDAVGGRVRTDAQDGYLLDRGFQILLTAYPEAKQLLNYDALDLKTFQSGALIRLNGGFSTMSDPFKEPSKFISTLLSPVGSLIDKLKVLKLSQEVSKESTEDFFTTQGTDTLSFLQAYGWSEDMIANFFKPFFGGVFLENELATSSNFFRFVFKQFYNGEAAIPARGMQAIPTQLANQLPAGAIQLATRVEKITGNTVLLSDGQTLTANSIVIATDATQADRLLNRSQQRTFNTTTCTYFAADRSPLTEKMLALNPNRLSVVHNVCVPSDIAPSYAPDGKSLISVSTQGISGVDEQKLTAHIVQELTSWFGEEVKTWKYLRTYYLPESLEKYTESTPPSSLKIAQNLFECGDHVAYPSLNAAMATGRKVAEMIANQ